MKHIAGPVFHDALDGVAQLLNRNNPGDIFFLRKICMTLNSTAVLSMCETIVYLGSQSARNLLMDFVKFKSREDVELIEHIVSHPDSHVILIGINLLKTLKDSSSEYLLFKLLKHPDDQVRSYTLDYFTDKPVSYLQRIFFLIDDPNMEIRIKLLKYIGSKRAVSSETLMMNYLQDIDEDQHSEAHVISCYRMLGKCGSERSIPFLRKKIFDGAWTGLFGQKNTSNRSGALVALSELETTEALKLLKKAANNKSPLVKKSYKMFIQ
jgi:HEAT repeat protein